MKLPYPLRSPCLAIAGPVPKGGEGNPYVTSVIAFEKRDIFCGLLFCSLLPSLGTRLATGEEL
jgi:hypothetical protein